MSAQVYSVPGQTQGRRKAFLEWKSIDLPNNLSLTCGGNVNYYKSFHDPIPNRGNFPILILAIFKINQQLYFQLSVKVYSLLGQTEGCKIGGHIVRLPPAALAITGAVRATSREKLYQESGFESLQQRCWYRKLCCLFKIINNQSLNYLFQLVPSPSTRYFVRNSENIPQLRTKHDFFKNSFFTLNYKRVEQSGPAYQKI